MTAAAFAKASASQKGKAFDLEGLWLRQADAGHAKTRRNMKNLWLAVALFVGSGSIILANGGAWQGGVPGTGSASASNKTQKTDVTIENEILKIDLHPEYADVTVRYRMHNTGAKVQQEFFFPVERWGANPDSDNQGKSDDIDHYQITVDGKELKWSNVVGPKEERSETKEATSETTQNNGQVEEKGSEEKEGSDAEEENDETTSGPFWQQDLLTIKSWKKSVIPFERNQTREVTVHYKARYAENDESVS